MWFLQIDLDMDSSCCYDVLKMQMQMQ